MSDNNNVEQSEEIRPIPSAPLTYNDIVSLVENLDIAMSIEYEASKFLRAANDKLDEIKANVIAKAHESEDFTAGLKVAQIAQKEKKLLLDSTEVKNASLTVSVALDAKETAKRQRVFHENILSLSKAYLYSQSGLGL